MVIGDQYLELKISPVQQVLHEPAAPLGRARIVGQCRPHGSVKRSLNFGANDEFLHLAEAQNKLLSVVDHASAGKTM